MKFYDASHLMTPEKRWTRIQNEYVYKPQIMPTLLRSIFDEAKKNNESPKFEIVKETVAKVEPRVRVKKEPKIKVKKEPKIKIKKVRIKKTAEEQRLHRIKYEKENAEHIKAKRREHYELNHSKLLEEKRAYHKANRDRIIQEKKQYRLDHKDEISLKKKEYYKRKKLEKENKCISI